MNHRGRIVDVGWGKKLGSKIAKNVLCGRHDFPVVFAAAGHIQQTDKDAFRTDANRIIKITSHSVTDKFRGDTGAFHLGKYRRNGLYQWTVLLRGLKEKAHCDQT